MNNYPASEKAFLGLNHAQVFVYVLMTVISILFLFITNAYLFRMNFQDWSPVPIPSLLWFNTICLVLASVGMAWSKSGAKASDHQKTKVGLAMAGVFVVAFVSVVFIKSAVNCPGSTASSPSKSASCLTVPILLSLS